MHRDWFGIDGITSTAVKNSVLGARILGAVLVLLFFGFVAANDADLAGGFDTTLRNLLYSIAGFIALMCGIHLVHRLSKNAGDRVGLRIESILEKLFFLTLVVSYLGVLFTAELYSSSVFFATLILVILFLYKAPLLVTKWSLNLDELVVRRESTTLVQLSLVVCLASIGVAVFLNWRHGDSSAVWHPTSTSQFPLRWFDYLAISYAFIMIGSLVTAIAYMYLWSWEYLRINHSALVRQDTNGVHTSGAERRESDVYDWLEGSERRSDVDVLEDVAHITSAAGSATAGLMGVFAILVLAFHPIISPTAMPVSLLTVVTFALAFIVTVIGLVRRQCRFARESLAECLRSSDEEHQSSERIRRTGLLRRTESLDRGVFRPWNQSTVGWLAGGGASLALIDLWIRWSTASF